MKQQKDDADPLSGIKLTALDNEKIKAQWQIW